MRSHLLVAITLALTAGGASAQGANAAKGDQEKLDAAADNLSRMKSALKQVLGRAEQARSDKDVVKLNCVNEKLTQIKSLINVAERSDIALHESIAAKDAGEAEFSKIAIARTKVDGLRGDAEQCVGQLAYNVEERTTVEVEQPANLPGRPLGLGVANREYNPADAVADIGFGVGSDTGGSWNRTFSPPVIVRAQAASPFR
ncbi:MAG TPA: hypothetical protein VF875_08865 [Anaeromyxobacter sp.]